MKAKDVMTRHVVTIAPNASILEALRLMLEHKISGLPVVNGEGNFAGIVTEGDFLRRAETGTERKRSRWFEFLVGPGALAADYVRSHEAKFVAVVEVCEKGIEAIARRHVDDVAGYLTRHRISVGSVLAAHAEGSVADELLRVAKAEGADLIVTGAYGHSRLGEWIFGGVTRDLLASSPVCCLLAN
jgi:nucleotide-binding universal stress UspA family protein